MPEAAPILAALERILAHRLFRNSARLSQFLRFIVEETLAGRATEIKEYTIGARIYERGADFEPKADAIVRVEAARLRTKLQQYYTGPAAEDPVRIGLPTGAYVPVFTESTIDSVPPARLTKPGLTRPVYWVALLVLACSAIAFASWRISRSPEATFRVTVVPFSNFTGDPAQDASAAGFTDQVAGRISSEPGIRVEHSLGASNAAVRGSLQNGDGERRLVVHLDDASGGQVWSATLYSRHFTPAQFEEMSAALVARTLNRRFGGRPVAASVEPLPRNQAAADLFVRGHKEWETQTREGVHNAASLFRQAAEQDPRYAGAWAELGASTLFLSYMEPANAARWNAEARAALRKALSIDDRNAEGHVRLGNLYLEQDWDSAAAERELQLGIGLSPGADAATRWFSLAASLRGHPDVARREVQYGLLMNPSSAVLLAEMARLDLQSERVSEARQFARESLATVENYAPAHFILGLIEERQGNVPAAHSHFEACGSARSWPFDCNASLSRLNGGHDTAGGFPRHYSRALLALDARRDEAALAEIREGLSTHESFIEYVCLDPQFRRLFREPSEPPCTELQSWIRAQPERSATHAESATATTEPRP